MKRGRTIFFTAALSIIFFAGSAVSEDFGTETQNLITRTMEAGINSTVQNFFSDQTAVNQMRNRMMSLVSDAVKKNTAARKRTTVIETCTECRAEQPFKVVISGRTTLLDADTQDIVNRAMARKIENTVRVISSDPAVARSVQERMMKKRMAASPLREKMQPFMISRLLFESSRINVAGNNGGTGENQSDKVTCSAADAGFPNC